MENNKYYDIPQSKENFVILKINGVNPTVEEFDDHVEKMIELCQLDKWSFFIFDVSAGKFLTSEQRVKIGTAMKSQTENFKKNYQGIIFVNKSIIPAMLLKGIFLVFPPPVPYEVCKSIEEAYAWGNRLLLKNK